MGFLKTLDNWSNGSDSISRWNYTIPTRNLPAEWMFKVGTEEQGKLEIVGNPIVRELKSKATFYRMRFHTLI